MSQRKPSRAVRAAARPDEPARRYHKIRWFEVESGFLHGVRLELSDHLNCVIGGRGTGKTTVLEFLRFALTESQDPRRSAREWQKLIKDNLGTGEVRVGIETRDGVRYTVVRSLGNPAEVRNDRDEPAGFSLTHGAVFDVDVYGQNEIEGIANDPSSQLALLDRFVSGEVRELEQKARALLHELEANAAELLHLQARRAALAEGLGELPALRDRLAGQAATSGESAQEVDGALALKGLRDREARALDGVGRFVGGRLAAAHELEASLSGAADLVAPEVMQGPNGAVFEPLVAAVAEGRRAAAAHLRAAADALQGCARAAQDARAALEPLHREQDARLHELIARHEEDKGRATERLHLQRKVNELLDRERTLTEVDQALDVRRRRRRELLQELQRWRDERFALRKDVAARLSATLGPTIAVSLSQGDDSTAYRELLQEVLKGAVRNHGQVATAVAERVPPRDLARLVQNDRVDELVEATKLARDRVDWLVGQLAANPALLFRIETAELQDVPRIQLQDGPAYKDSSSLSTGQKCTTILPILLLESEKPLLIDQPEDNLDNRFIYETVVSRLRDVEFRRQLVFVTHNPNIPVLGDAGRVFVMESDGRRARVQAAGSVDEVKEHVETILEGGREAFEARKRRYGR